MRSGRWLGMVRCAVVLLAAMAPVAMADADTGRDLGRGYRLEVGPPEHQGLFVIKAGTRAILEHEVYKLGKVTIDDRAGKIDADVEDITCVGQHHHTWTFAHLDARLANSAAFALHQRKK